ncbi:hypothetical protein M407DRAFT_137679 [Tulasnella calospora MUT 4182]|uniref:Uncharacterized protein n=1 Tax=Tulasnella calospora MUT 4182 TaxID=1051891 RepID=A0A0C3KFV9_9AGAM|nr:hypothetical protein M407DRAFT_137679 [Tulasnella calospora MUT 4182]
MRGDGKGSGGEGDAGMDEGSWGTNLFFTCGVLYDANHPTPTDAPRTCRLPYLSKSLPEHHHRRQASSPNAKRRFMDKFFGVDRCCALS